MLGVNQLTGSIPPELGTLDNLQQLNLMTNQLAGSIPPELGNLVNLFSLILSSNQLTGSIPPELGDLSQLTFLDLNNNQLSGSLPFAIGNLTALAWLYLQDNQLSGEFPSTITNLTHLQELAFDCPLTSSDPAVIAFLDTKAPGWQARCTALTVSKTGTGGGTVTSSPAGISCGSACASPFLNNSNVMLTASPAPGTIFTGWSGGGCSGHGACTVTVNVAKTVEARFDLAAGQIFLPLIHALNNRTLRRFGSWQSLRQAGVMVGRSIPARHNLRKVTENYQTIQLK